MVNATPEYRRIEKHRPALRKTVKVQIERSRRHCKGRSFGELRDCRKLPATKRLAQPAFVSSKEWQTIGAVSGEPVRCMEARKSTCIPSVVSVLIAVARTDKG